MSGVSTNVTSSNVANKLYSTVSTSIGSGGGGGGGETTSIPTYIWSNQAMLEELFDIKKPLANNKAKRYLNGASQTVENSGASYLWHNDTQMRVHVFYPGNFTDDDGPTADFAEGLDGQWLTIAQRGYMLDAREASHGIILVDAEIHPTDNVGSGGLTIEAFSGLLHDETVIEGRAGACYHWEINLNGESAIQKEQVHVDYTSQIVGGSTFNTEQRFQFICVCKRINDADRMAGTTIELWAKRPGQSAFVKDVSKIDAHNWGDAMEQFHSSFEPGQAITWGSDCAITFKGNERDYRLYDFKVYKLNY